MSDVLADVAADRVIVALDTPKVESALKIVDRLTPTVSRFKVGLELFCAGGLQAVSAIQKSGGELFVDLKLHDIPNTVAGAARVLNNAGVWMTNVHASGGRDMMTAAREALGETILLAVTVLTSIDQQTFSEHWQIQESIVDTVGRWAETAAECGLDGVVCSPQEVEIIRQTVGDDFLVVTPGIRPKWAAAGDQRRITTPQQAIERGSDYLVIGRPITQADNPQAAAEKIIASVGTSLEGRGIDDR